MNPSPSPPPLKRSTSSDSDAEPLTDPVSVPSPLTSTSFVDILTYIESKDVSVADMMKQRALVPFPALEAFKPLHTMYLLQRANFWVEQEISFDQDRTSYNEKLTPSERHVVSTILAFFASADGLAAKVQKGFLKVFDAIPEAARLLNFQTMMEDIHALTYIEKLKAVHANPQDILLLSFGLVSVPTVSAKIEWARRYMNNDTLPISVKMFAQACNEGVMFSSSFTILYYFRSKGAIPGIGHANELISRDENFHVFTYGLLEDCLSEESESSQADNEFLTKIYGQKKITQDEAHQILASAVDVEIEFAKYALSGGINGLTLELMVQQIKWFANVVLAAYKFEELYPGIEPIEFMRSFGNTVANNKNNFFERRSGAYARVSEQKRAPAIPCIGDCI